jgi:hypothetical protein
MRKASMKTESKLNIPRLPVMLLLCSSALFFLTGCEPPCPVFDHCAEYFKAEQDLTSSVCNDYYGLKRCYGEQTCEETIEPAAQAVDSCKDLQEDWVGTCEFTDQPNCDRQVQYHAYLIGCDAECRRSAPEIAQYACEGSGGKWTTLQ